MRQDRNGAPRRMGNVVQIVPRETVRIDHEPLARLYAALGTQGAEDVIARAVEDIAHRLARIETDHRDLAFDRLERGARMVAAVAAPIGLGDLSRVSAHVAACALRNDAAALGATVARLARLGRRAMTDFGRMRQSGG
ncbi:MAG: hypothetical protein GW886_13905 [Rhodobacterales bacterium]|nr:hypothetical protein [Rhodobacterales bacterium]